MANNVYIEDVTPEALKEMILSNDELKFKHKDNCMVFTSEGDHLYAEDIDAPDADLFADGDFVGAIIGFYKELSPVIELLESLASVGLVLELSDAVNTFNMPLEELSKAQAA